MASDVDVPNARSVSAGGQAVVALPLYAQSRSATAEARGGSRSFPLLHVPLPVLLVLIDLLSFVVALVVAGRAHVSFVLLLVALLSLNASGGYYRPRLSLSVLDELPGFVGRALIAGAVATSFKVVVDVRVGERMLETAALFAGLALVGRAAGYALVRHLRRSGSIAHSTVIIGAGAVGGQLARILAEHPECGLRPVGFIDNDPLLAPEERSVPLLGGTAALARVLDEHDIRNVIVAYGATRESGVVDILRTCDRLRSEIFLVPRLYEMQALSHDMDHAWGMPLVRLRRAAYRTVTWRLKRVLDAGLAALALIALSPVLAVCAGLVRLECGPRVIFRQERVGLDGRPFTLLKFRSLTPANDDESASHWNIGHDARVGPVGRFLRRTSMDELPQLWNILRGDMSLVGPRPERPYFVQEFTAQFPRYIARHRVPAGLTGWAQVHGLRGDTSIADRARFDNYYIENWSLWEDLKILVRTFAQVGRATGR